MLKEATFLDKTEHGQIRIWELSWDKIKIIGELSWDKIKKYLLILFA
jgi:hypothetical protein